MIREKGKVKVEEIRETHQMRYLFKPEVESFLAQCKFDLVAEEEWMSGTPPGFNTWGVVFIGKALS
jgi:hypothetical protein